MTVWRSPPLEVSPLLATQAANGTLRFHNVCYATKSLILLTKLLVRARNGTRRPKKQSANWMAECCPQGGEVPTKPPYASWKGWGEHNNETVGSKKRLRKT